MSAAELVDAVEAKAVATVAARAALRGYQLVQLGDGTFMASKWDLFRPLATLADVEAFLRRIGAPA